jgi:uncharacterized protein (TIGR04255 family)
MSSKLPTKLKKEPLVDAIFEIRFTARVPASNILPGILYDKLDGDKILEQMPAAQIPKQMRDADPNLQFAPLVRIVWKEYLVMISDKSIAIGCKMPYPGWANFYKAIIQVLKNIAEISAIETIQRYSFKYVDLLPNAKVEDQVSSVNIKVAVGTHNLEKERFQFRIEIPQDGFIKSIQIAADATVTTIDKKTMKGLVVDIDTVREVPNERVKDFIVGLEGKLNTIHGISKATFFECITSNTLKVLEPTYD